MVYDPMEPFQPLETDRDAPIRTEIGSSQNGTDFQGHSRHRLHLSVLLALVSTLSSTSCTKLKRHLVRRLQGGGTHLK